MSAAPILQHGLHNGLRVVLAPDSRTPIVAISLSYIVGSRHEEPGRSGFAHLFEHMMFQGSERVAKGDHFRLIQAVGGRTNAYTGLDSTVYSDTLPSHQLEFALWLEADRMRTLGPTLTQETLDNQRDVVKNERRKKVDNTPYGTWEERTFALAYPPAHPYHHSSWGSMEDLSAASLDEVQAFFARHYVPDNAVLTIVGDLDADQALEMVDRHFGPIQRGSQPTTQAVGQTGPFVGADAPGGVREKVLEAAPLPRLFVGCPVPPLGDDLFDVSDLVTDLLSTGRASRLHARLIRDLRLAQWVDAWTVPLVGGPSLLVIEVGAREGVEPPALEAALAAELERLADEPASEEELARVRLGRATNRATARQESEERADRIGMYASLLRDPDRFGTESARDASIDADAVRACARDSLGERNRAYVWYVPG